jgi:hypothetical protein
MKIQFRFDWTYCACDPRSQRQRGERVMGGFGSILAVLSGGVMPGHVQALALSLARADQAALTFVDVLDDVAPDLPEADIAARRARLAAAVESASRSGIAASEAVVRGSPAVEVIRMVLREGHDLVLIAAGDADETARRLLADCPCPVWLVAEGRPDAVIALLPEGSSADGAQVLALAERLSTLLGVEVVRAGDAAALPDHGSAVLVAIGAGRAAGSVVALKPEGFTSPVTLEAAPQDGTAGRATGRAGKG